MSAEAHEDDYVPFDKSGMLPDIRTLIPTLAWADFRAWRDEHDPLNNLSFEEQACAYARAKMEKH